MPRPATARPLGEHLVILSRMIRQVEAGEKEGMLKKPRAKKLKKLLAQVMREYQLEMGI